MRFLWRVPPRHRGQLALVAVANANTYLTTNANASTTNSSGADPNAGAVAHPKADGYRRFEWLAGIRVLTGERTNQNQDVVCIILDVRGYNTCFLASIVGFEYPAICPPPPQ